MRSGNWCFFVCVAFCVYNGPCVYVYSFFPLDFSPSCKLFLFLVERGESSGVLVVAVFFFWLAGFLV